VLREGNLRYLERDVWKGIFRRFEGKEQSGHTQKTICLIVLSILPYASWYKFGKVAQKP
jgi:hypothetical protein